MEGFTGTITPPGMYVRALYDYDADDDKTSLSFRHGDIIQVLTQLESGWWDGIIHEKRGWFPSNYCIMVGAAEARRLDHDQNPDQQEDIEATGESEDDYEDHDFDSGFPPESLDTSPHLGDAQFIGSSQEEAAFWIPQATPDGRLFYFNTMTGYSTMDLPLESPMSPNETGPRDRTNMFTADNARPPPELMASGRFEKEDDTDFEQSASETEETSKSRGSISRKRSSYISEGASPATSLESLSMPARSRADTHKSEFSGSSLLQGTNPALGPAMTSFTRPIFGPGSVDSTMPFSFTDNNPVSLTWNRLISDMETCVGNYQQAIENDERAEFVQRAEEMSDHLRLLLAAGSGTTDNHSGNPSIISANKPLYPHFRDMMSRFSKLVLNSHIAAGDYPPGDSSAKCLQEAEGVLKGVYGFVEVARQQRGEVIPRLFPGFVTGSYSGGSWQNNGLYRSSASSASFAGTDDESLKKPNLQLDDSTIERMNELKRPITVEVRKLEERLSLQDKIISHQAHRRFGSDICSICTKVIELYKPWMSTMEGVDLAHLGRTSDTTTLNDFLGQKQKVYNLVAELVVQCQQIAAPLADEWAADRGDSLEERVQKARSTLRDLDAVSLQIKNSLQRLREAKARTSSIGGSVEGRSVSSHRQTASTESNRSRLDDISSAVSLSETTNTSVTGVSANAEKSKVKKFFGETPPGPTSTVADETPWYLRLDHEGDILYDHKTKPPTIRGGTLLALVEQLTRHDGYNSSFNNTFLLTYQSFTSASELFELLVRRWSIQSPPGLTSEELTIWLTKKQTLVRFRILNIVKNWLEFYWMEGTDAASKELLQRIYSFFKDTVRASGSPNTSNVLQLIEQRLRGEDPHSKHMVPNSNQEAPPPILPRSMKKLKFQDIDPIEFARQLTIIESKLYGKIKPYECLNKIWQKKDLPDNVEPAANVKALILHSNMLTNWVAEMILTQSDLKKRVAVIKHFVAVADKCHSMHNFSTLTSIISALGTAPIHRLTRTWAQVSGKTKTSLENLRKLMGSTKNFAEYREALARSNPPCIPFFGVYLTDLTFIEDGIPGIIKKIDLINFAKRAKTAEVIGQIQEYQKLPYPYKSVPELQNYILDMMQSAGEVHEMYEKSLQVEPREREDEKIARLLSESGFL